MTSLRQLKLLGFALLALVATSAAAAPGAQAGTLTAGAYPATITQTSVAFNFFKTSYGLMTCWPSFHGELTEASEELTLTPTFKPLPVILTSCEQGGKVTHLNTNGCDFRVRAGEEVEEDVVAGTLDIVCPEGKMLDFEITGFSPACHLTVPPQENLTGVPGGFPAANGIFIADKTPNSVHVSINPGGIRYILSGGCPLTGEFTNGVYVGGATLIAKSGGMETTFSVDG